VGSTKSMSGHIMSNLCFCIWRELLVKKCILVGLGCETSMHYFSCSVGTSAGSIKSVSDTLRQTSVFASDGFCG
jgi:hypothetical protein